MWGPSPSLQGIAVQFLFFPTPSELAHFLISYIGFSLHNPTHTMSHGCIPRKTDAPFGRWLIVFSLLLDRPLSPIFSVPSCLTLEDHLVFMFPCFPPSSPYCKYADCGYIEGSGEVTTYRLSPVLRLCVGGHQLCGNSSRLRYSDPNPRGQSRACFGNKFYVNTGTPIMGTLFVAAFHTPKAETMWPAKPAIFTLWPFAQRLPRPDNRFFSLVTPWPLAGMAQPGSAGSFHLNSWLLLAASPQSLIVVEVAP